MKMLRHSPDELILLHRPVVLCTVLLAGTLFLAGVTVWNFGNADWLKAGLGALCTLGLLAPALWFAAERVDVRFDARSGCVTIDTRTLAGTTSEMHPLGAVKRALVQTHKGPSDAAGAHRVALEINPGGPHHRHPLTTGYASGTAVAALVDRINGWLAQQRTASDA